MFKNYSGKIGFRQQIDTPFEESESYFEYPAVWTLYIYFIDSDPSVKFMKIKPKIARVAFKELPKILELQKFCYRENALRYNNDHIMPLTQTQHDLEEEFRDTLFLKAVLDDELIGSIRGFQNNMTGYIVRLFVHPDHQNKGVAKQLMTAIEQQFPHVFRYELFTGYKDEKNIHFYTKLGYRKFKEDKRDDGMIFYFLEKICDLV